MTLNSENRLAALSLWLWLCLALTAAAANAGVRSLSIEAAPGALNASQDPARENVYALIVRADESDDPKLNSVAAMPDYSEQLQRVVLSLNPFSVEISMFAGRQATRSHVLRELTRLTKIVGPDDQFLFVLIGYYLHGEKPSQGYIPLYDVALQDIEFDGLTADVLRRYLAKIGGRKKLTLLQLTDLGSLSLGGFSKQSRSRRPLPLGDFEKVFGVIASAGGVVVGQKLSNDTGADSGTLGVTAAGAFAGALTRYSDLNGDGSLSSDELLKALMRLASQKQSYHYVSPVIIIDPGEPWEIAHFDQRFGIGGALPDAPSRDAAVREDFIDLEKFITTTQRRPELVEDLLFDWAGKAYLDPRWSLRLYDFIRNAKRYADAEPRCLQAAAKLGRDLHSALSTVNLSASSMSENSGTATTATSIDGIQSALQQIENSCAGGLKK